MIRIHRDSLSEALAGQLSRLTGEIHETDLAGRIAEARRLWRHSTVRRRVRTPLAEVLRRMAAGREYCMYCGDNRGLDIDHFEPLSRNPLRTFDWPNHLLACSGCNSGRKSDRFPVDEEGSPLLVDPTTEDPFDHLLLTLSLGTYHPLTPKGEATIEVCDLNNENLTKGRAHARVVFEMCLQKWAQADLCGDEPRKAYMMEVAQSQPFADVCQAMLRQASLPSALLVFDDSGVVEILRRPDLRKLLLR